MKNHQKNTLPLTPIVCGNAIGFPLPFVDAIWVGFFYTTKLKFMMKTCNTCFTEKTIDRFGKNKSTKDGKCYYCKDCIKKSATDYRKANKVKIAESQRERYKDPKKRKDKLRLNELWRQNNRSYYRDYYQAKKLNLSTVERQMLKKEL